MTTARFRRVSVALYSSPVLVPKEVEGPVPSNAEGLAPSDAEGLAPSNVEGLAPSNVEGLAPSNVEGLVPRNVEGLVPRNADVLVPDDVEERAARRATISYAPSLVPLARGMSRPHRGVPDPGGA
jgi:hypothetical protein